MVHRLLGQGKLHRVVLSLGGNGVAGLEITVEQLQRQRVEQVLLNGPLERARAELRIVQQCKYTGRPCSISMSM